MTDELPDPPYPPDTKARGWRFDLDMERIRASDTWALAKPEQRPWLLMVWTMSWEMIPVGTYPDDDEVIAAHIGMPVEQFQMWRRLLMRGWHKHSNGRLYHPVVTEAVLRFVTIKQAEAARKAAYRERMKMSHGTPPDIRGRPIDVPPCPASGTLPTPTPTPTTTTSVPPNGGTGRKRPIPPDPVKDEVWRLGKDLLMAQGMGKDQAGTFLGKLVKDYGQLRVLDVVRSADRVRPVNAHEWLKAACQERVTRGGKQSALEARNKAVAEAWEPPEVRDAAKRGS